MENKNIIDYIIENKNGMTKKQQQLSDFILNNYQDVTLMTVSKLAEEAAVGKTTVLRFVQELGFNSFFELKKELYEIQREYSGKWENIQLSFQEKEKNNTTNTLYEVWSEEIRILDESLTPQLVENFEKAVELIANCSKLNLLGLRPYRGLAVYAEVLLTEFYANINQLSNDSETILDKVLHMTKDDVLLIFELSPITARTIDAAEVAKKRGAEIVLITDNLSSPIAKYSDILLRINSSERYFTVVAIIALIEALTVELGQREAPGSVDKIKSLSKLVKDKGYVVE